MEIGKAVNAALYSLWEFYSLEYLIRAGGIITGLLNISRVKCYKSDVFFMLQRPVPLKSHQISSLAFKPFYFTIQPYNFWQISKH